MTVSVTGSVAWARENPTRILALVLASRVLNGATDAAIEAGTGERLAAFLAHADLLRAFRIIEGCPCRVRAEPDAHDALDDPEPHLAVATGPVSVVGFGWATQQVFAAAIQTDTQLESADLSGCQDVSRRRGRRH